MRYSENTLNILAAKSYRGIGRAWIVKNLKGGESVQAIVSLLNRNAGTGSRTTVEEFEIQKGMERDRILKLKGAADGAVALGDDDFPPYRGNVKNSEQPVVLFYRGDISLLGKAGNNVAVIGLVNPEPEIKVVEEKAVSELVKHNAVVISGLALGCDSIAHRETLRLKGKTAAVLPGPLNSILPASNRLLADQIVENNGLLVSEYYENANSTQELRGRYQERDRLQALFSDMIVLTASYAENSHGNDSGSRLAMKYALNYSIPRTVLYDSFNDAENPMYDLNRQLIKEDPEIIVINRNNLRTAVVKIMSDIEKTKKQKMFGNGDQGELDFS